MDNSVYYLNKFKVYKLNKLKIHINVFTKYTFFTTELRKMGSEMNSNNLLYNILEDSFILPFQ